MLEGLDQVDWTLYSHAYGKATDLPDLIRQLTNPNAEAADEALSAFFGNIWHQGTVYSATAITVPFLIEILAHKGSSRMAGILDLLKCCATGSGYMEVHGSMDHYRDQRQTPELQDTIAEELQNVHSAYEAVVAGLPVYITLLNDPDVEIRTSAASVIALGGPERGQAAKALRDRIAFEYTLNTPVSDATTANLISCLGDLLTRPRARTQPSALSQADQGLFEAWVSDPLYPLLARTTAALRLITSGDESRRQMSIDLLLALPDLPAIPLGEMIYGIVEALAAQSLSQTIDWLTWMINYDDQATVSTLPYLVRTLYTTYRQNSQPLLNIMIALLQQEVKDTDLGFPVFRRPFQSTQELFQELIDAEPDEQIKALLRHHQSLLKRPDNKPSIQPLDTFLGPRSIGDTSVDDMLSYLQGGMTSGQKPLRASLKDGVKSGQKQMDTRTLLLQLADHSDALNDARTLPLLVKALEHNDQWIRVYAARTLALLAPHHAWDHLRRILTEELRGRPAGLVAMDTLRRLAEADFDVAWALPTLEAFVNSPFRIMEMGDSMSIPAQDDYFRSMAQTTLDTIQSASEQRSNPDERDE